MKGSFEFPVSFCKTLIKPKWQTGSLLVRTKWLYTSTLLKLNTHRGTPCLKIATESTWTAVLDPYLDLHVEVSLLALLPLLCLHPLLLLQTLHQLLGDIHVSHRLEHLTWNIGRGPNENHRANRVQDCNVSVFTIIAMTQLLFPPPHPSYICSCVLKDKLAGAVEWNLYGTVSQTQNLKKISGRKTKRKVTYWAWTHGCRPTCMRWCSGALRGHRHAHHSCALWPPPWCTVTPRHHQTYTTGQRERMKDGGGRWLWKRDVWGQKKRGGGGRGG